MRYPKDFLPSQKKQYDDFISKVLEMKCRLCSGKFKKIGLWKVECLSCKEKFRIKKPDILKRGLANSANWKATCNECGGQMDYYNFRYCCNKCGNILEV